MQFKTMWKKQNLASGLSPKSKFRVSLYFLEIKSFNLKKKKKQQQHYYHIALYFVVLEYNFTVP